MTSARSWTGRSPKPRRWWAASSCSNATHERKRSPSPLNVRRRNGQPSRCASSGHASRDPSRALSRDVTTRTNVDHVHRTVEAVWRIESAKIIGGLTRVLRDVALAEELAQDALVAALEQWPAEGMPD